MFGIKRLACQTWSHSPVVMHTRQYGLASTDVGTLTYAHNKTLQRGRHP